MWWIRNSGRLLSLLGKLLSPNLLSCQRHWTNSAIMDSQRHWTNSFHLLARANGRYESGEVKGSGPKSQSLQQVIEYALNEESANVLKDKGKDKMGEDKEILMRGFSPTT